MTDAAGSGGLTRFLFLGDVIDAVCTGAGLDEGVRALRAAYERKQRGGGKKRTLGADVRIGMGWESQAGGVCAAGCDCDQHVCIVA